mgnify:CR=1 FL=1
MVCEQGTNEGIKRVIKRVIKIKGVIRATDLGRLKGFERSDKEELRMGRKDQRQPAMSGGGYRLSPVAAGRHVATYHSWIALVCRTIPELEILMESFSGKKFIIIIIFLYSVCCFYLFFLFMEIALRFWPFFLKKTSFLFDIKNICIEGLFLLFFS